MDVQQQCSFRDISRTLGTSAGGSRRQPDESSGLCPTFVPAVLTVHASLHPGDRFQAWFTVVMSTVDGHPSLRDIGSILVGFIGIPPTYVELAVAPNDLLCGTTFQEA